MKAGGGCTHDDLLGEIRDDDLLLILFRRLAAVSALTDDAVLQPNTRSALHQCAVWYHVVWMSGYLDRVGLDVLVLLSVTTL